MKTLQLLTHRDPTGARSLEAVDNPRAADPESFDDPAQDSFIPRLGTSDLLSVAVKLRGADYRVARIDLRDGRFQELQADDEDALVEDLLDLLDEGDLPAALTYMRGPGRGTYVISVTFQAPTKFLFTLGQNGTLRADIKRLGSQFLSVLAAAIIGSTQL